MGKNKLFDLFDDKLRTPGELIAGEPQNLDSIAGGVVDSDTVLRKIQQFEIVKPKVDYSDFANFVFFNSAFDYFNISGDKILNQFPYDGTTEDVELFKNSLDDYQRYLLDVWPKRQGHLDFQPGSGFAYVAVDDVGKHENVSKTSLLSPQTGSMSLEFWSISPPALTGTSDVMVIAQKVTGSGEGFTAFFSGSSAFFRVVSGSTTDEISVPFVPAARQYFCFSYDRSGVQPIMSAFTGSFTEFPVRVAVSTGSVQGIVNAGTSKFFMGSGSLSGKRVRPLTGSLDDVRVWKKSQVVSDLTSSFNARIYSDEDLCGLWRFNESGSNVDSERTIVRDHSGKKLDGRIQNYFTALRGSGSILPYDSSDLILSVDAPEVYQFVQEMQTSGSTFDKTNDNSLSRMFPEQMLLLEEIQNTSVLKNLLFMLGRFFDQFKIRIDQFVHVLNTSYGSYDQAPDALLAEIGKFFGWEFTGNFLNADVLQYIVGRQVLKNTASNKELDMKLYQIKNEFWKRTLINLMHLYKTKGARESVESLLRLYGVNKNFVRLKEYGTQPSVGIGTYRIFSEKSVPVLTFGSGSTRATSYVQSKPFTSTVHTVETRVRFPTAITSDLTSSLFTGSIWSINTASNGAQERGLFFVRPDLTSGTGSLIYTGSEGRVELTASIFDNEWYNIAVVRDYLSSSLRIDVRGVDQGEQVYHVTSSLFAVLSSGSSNHRLWLGSTGSLASEYWMQEARVWSEPLSEVELKDHALNFQSYGTEEADGAGGLSLHWRLNESAATSATGLLYNSIQDFAGTGVSGSGAGFIVSVNPYKKFLNEFSYIASPEYGWNEEKIRIIGSSVVPQDVAFADNTVVALEFNLVDALNEDISQVLATLDTFNESVGDRANMYRDQYPDLSVLRENYFRRLNGTMNFRVFADLLEFFDRSFVDMIKRLIPAKANFLGDEFVVESHMLERPKLQWTYRRRDPEFAPEGRIRVYVRT